jgi:hypothetical protein
VTHAIPLNTKMPLLYPRVASAAPAASFKSPSRTVGPETPPPVGHERIDIQDVGSGLGNSHRERRTLMQVVGSSAQINIHRTG